MFGESFYIDHYTINNSPLTKLTNTINLSSVPNDDFTNQTQADCEKKLAQLSPNSFKIPYNHQSFSFTKDCEYTLDNINNEYIIKINHNIKENKNTDQMEFCYHIGVLIFAPFISLLQKSGLGACKSFVMQWMVAILLGTKNIEQSKLLNFRSLNIFLDKPIRNLHEQRMKLKEFSTKDNITNLLIFNAEIVEANKMNTFYYDPHTKHYTGLQKILKSWCSKIRMADKVINTDYFHTIDGYPVYLKNGDTFEDLNVE